MMWNSREIWHVQDVSHRKIFAVATLNISNYRDHSGKKMSKPPEVSGLFLAIYLECK